jgi:hypothetical protein
VHSNEESVQIPLQLELPGPDYFVSVLRVPGQAPRYTMQVGSIGYIRIEPDPERAGPSRLRVSCYTAFGSPSRVDRLELTIGTAEEPPGQQPLTRQGRGSFVADVLLPSGAISIGVVATTRDGTRLRGVFGLEIPDD